MDQVWILTRGDYCDPTTVLGVYPTRERGADWFTRTALRDFPEINKLAKGDDGSLRLEGGADFLALDPHTVSADEPGREVVSYRGQQYVVMWLGGTFEGTIPVVDIAPLGWSGVRQTVRVADLDRDGETR